MSFSLKNKIVFITGASSGIGEACAKTFAEAGAKLIICARGLDKVKQLAESLAPTEVLPLQLDVRDKNAVNQVINNLPTAWQNIDILINNAGLALETDKVQEGNSEDWEQMIDTNIKGLLYVTRALLPGMITRKQGHVIHIGSLAGHEVYSGGAVYCATKYAVKAINQGLKKDLLGTAIRVSSVDPGIVETNFSKVRFKGDIERAKKVYAGLQPLTAEDVADAILYCATRPANVNIRDIVILPTAQAGAVLVARKST